VRFMDESWKTISGYEISNFGRVKNPKGHLITGWLRNGYRTITINQIGKCYVHRLVAESFCEGYFEGALVDHIDGDRLNNHFTNLRWVTRSENYKPPTKSYKRLSKYQVSLILNLHDYGLNRSEISKVIWTDRRNVSRILNGRNWSEYTGISNE